MLMLPCLSVCLHSALHTPAKHGFCPRPRTIAIAGPDESSETGTENSISTPANGAWSSDVATTSQGRWSRTDPNNHDDENINTTILLPAHTSPSSMSRPPFNPTPRVRRSSAGLENHQHPILTSPSPNGRRRAVGGGRGGKKKQPPLPPLAFDAKPLNNLTRMFAASPPPTPTTNKALVRPFLILPRGENESRTCPPTFRPG